MFSQFVYAHLGYEMCASMLTWNPSFGIATGINILIKPKLSVSNSDRNIKN